MLADEIFASFALQLRLDFGRKYKLDKPFPCQKPPEEPLQQVERGANSLEKGAGGSDNNISLPCALDDHCRMALQLQLFQSLRMQSQPCIARANNTIRSQTQRSNLIPQPIVGTTAIMYAQDRFLGQKSYSMPQTRGSAGEPARVPLRCNNPTEARPFPNLHTAAA